MVLIILSADNVFADIYKYIDNLGIVHFTNVPTSSKYKLYIKEKKKKNIAPDQH